MTQDQFIQSEIYKLVRFDYPLKKQLEVVEMVNKIDFSFSENGKEILVEGCGYNNVYGWSEEKGVISLLNK